MPRGEGIKKLNSLFDKYKQTLKAPQASVVTAFCEVVEDVLGISIIPSKVSYTPSTRILYIKNGALRTELKLHESELLTHLKGRLGESSCPKKII